jgi:hypothetical protein
VPIFKEEDDHDVLRGQYHGHPYGGLNLVVPLDKGAQLKGLQGWRGPSWTAPDPGSDRGTFYGYTGRGYTDYPFYEATVPDPLPAA